MEDLLSTTREKTALTAERKDLHELVERKKIEHDRLSEEYKELTSLLEKAQKEKTAALVQVEEVSSKELTLQYK